MNVSYDLGKHTPTCTPGAYRSRLAASVSTAGDSWVVVPICTPAATSFQCSTPGRHSLCKKCDLVGIVFYIVNGLGLKLLGIDTF